MTESYDRDALLAALRVSVDRARRARKHRPDATEEEPPGLEEFLERERAARYYELYEQPNDAS